jgi:hypothetical protein
MERKIHLAHGNSTGHVSAVVRHGNGQRREHPGYSNPFQDSRLPITLASTTRPIRLRALRNSRQRQSNTWRTTCCPSLYI